MKQIIIDVNIEQKKVAILEENELIEIYIEREGDKRITGNIYKGRVVNVLPGMQAAFVDIGLNKNAYLYVKDALPKEVAKEKHLKKISISDVVKSGQDIVVQVVKEPFEDKGARVSTHISIPGRQIVMLEGTDYIGVSRRIEDNRDRNRLRNLAKKYKPKNKGVILRTASKDVSEEDLKNDMAFLVETLETINKEKKLGLSPKIIYEELDLVHRTIRDLFTDDIARIVINNKDVYQSVYQLAQVLTPDLKSRIELFDSKQDIFDHFKINPMISKALEKRVLLDSGGYLIIDETEALVSIDINTGKYVGDLNLRDTVLKINLEAAQEIAKQLRLRNISGIIIIDFIDMKTKKDEKQVINELEAQLKKDKVQTQIFGMTKLGLLEMTRKKIGSRVSEKLLKHCLNCQGTGKISCDEEVLVEIEKQAERTKNHTTAEAMIFKVSPYMKNYIEQDKKAYISKLQEQLNLEIFFISDNTIDNDCVKIFKIGKIEFIVDTLNLI